MNRREFIALVGGAVAWPLAVRAQPSGVPVIGFLNPASPDGFAARLRGFRQGLKDTGYVEGKNVTVEYRWAEGRIELLPVLAADLVRRQVNVIVAVGGDTPALAAKSATTTIPIVFTNGSDPVKSGLVRSLNRPGGNVTGISLLAGTVNTKRLELIHELVPQAASVAVLDNPLVTEGEARLRDLREAARTLGLRLLFQSVRSERELDAAFATIADQKAGALFVDGNPFFVSRRDQLIGLAARQALPTMYFEREFAAAGGLMSYGTNFADAYRQAGIYTGRILRDAKPADLPVMQPTKFELVINLKAAKAIGLKIPESFLLRADEVIE